MRILCWSDSQSNKAASIAGRQPVAFLFLDFKILSDAATGKGSFSVLEITALLGCLGSLNFFCAHVARSCSCALSPFGSVDGPHQDFFFCKRAREMLGMTIDKSVRLTGLSMDCNQQQHNGGTAGVKEQFFLSTLRIYEDALQY